MPHEVTTNVESVEMYLPDKWYDAHEGRTFTEAPVLCGKDITCPGLPKFAGSCDLRMGYRLRVNS